MLISAVIATLAAGSLTVRPVNAKFQVAAPPVSAISTSAPTQAANAAGLVTAATESAVASLKVQVDRLPLGKKADGSPASVADYLDATRGHAFLTASLSRAQLIGGPRMVDERTLQVRLDVVGSVVAESLSQIAAVNPKVAGFPPRTVAEQSRAWSDQTFTATGTATTGASIALPPKPVTAVGTGLGVSPTPPITMAAPAASMAASAVAPSVESTIDPRSDPTAMSTGPASQPQAQTPEAIAAARQSALGGLLARVDAVVLPGGRTGKDFTTLPKVREALADLVNRAELLGTSNDAKGDLTVRLRLASDPALEVLRSAAMNAAPGAFPKADTDWDSYRMALVPALGGTDNEVVGVARQAPTRPTAGSGSISNTSIPAAQSTGMGAEPLSPRPLQTPLVGTSPAGNARIVPGSSVKTFAQASSSPQAAATSAFPIDSPPAWYFESIDAEGTAPFQGTKLQTARAAETQAVKALKTQLERLTLTPKLSVGQAIQGDPRLADALSRALDRARVYRVEYLEDGSAAVRATTDTRYLWQDLAALSSR